MTLHLKTEEFDSRPDTAVRLMEEQELDAIILFAHESIYWLAGYNTFGFCFFQCMIVLKDGNIFLLTRAPDIGQAQHTSIVEDIRIWVDQGSISLINQLKELLFECDLLRKRIRVELDTHGSTGKIGLQIDECPHSLAKYEDTSDIILQSGTLKNQPEIEYIRRVAEISDEAYRAVSSEIRPGADEGMILAAMQGKIFEGGGDYSGNDPIIGSGRNALMCRYKPGRRKLSKADQTKLEFAEIFRHYYSAFMRATILGKSSSRQLEMHEAAIEALLSAENAIKLGNIFGDIFDIRATFFDSREIFAHRLNACRYSHAARFINSCMNWSKFYKSNQAPIISNMPLFDNLTLTDSENDVVMTHGRTYLTTEGVPRPLSKLDLQSEIIE